MAVTLTAALEEQYASGGEDLGTLVGLIIDHPAFDAPARLVSDIDGPGNGLDPTALIQLPDAQGVMQSFQPCAFAIVRPGADKDGPTDGKIRVDNVSNLLNDALRAAMGTGEACSVEFWQYLIPPAGVGAITAPDEVLDGLQMQTVTLTASTAEGTVGYVDGRKLNVPTGPNAFFDRDNYSALFL